MSLTWAALGSEYQSPSQEQFIFLVQTNLQNLHAHFILKFYTINISIREKFLWVLESPVYASFKQGANYYCPDFAGDTGLDVWPWKYRWVAVEGAES